MNYKLFCFMIFLIQFFIAVLNFRISKRHKTLLDYEAFDVDILCGISWTATGLYWLYLCLSS